MKIQTSFLTPDFKRVDVPYLKGTEKQIKYANDIRDKYIDVFNRKLVNTNLSIPEKSELTEKFIAYIQNDIMTESYNWIENHCPRCGCYLATVEDNRICTNDYCTFKKTSMYAT